LDIIEEKRRRVKNPYIYKGEPPLYIEEESTKGGP
jgi:hypothetical protein